MLLPLTSTVDQTSRVLLANVMPWIYKASLALYIGTAACHTATNLKFGSCTALSSLSLWLNHRNLSLSVNKVKSRSLTPSLLWLVGAGIDINVYAFYWRPYHMHHNALQYYGQVFRYNKHKFLLISLINWPHSHIIIVY